MAFLEQRSGQYRVIFRLAGRRFTRSLKTRNEKEAVACVARLEDNVRRFELGLLSLPDDADIADFLISDGRSASKPAVPAIRMLREACDAYLEALSVGAVETSTLKCVSVHIGHLCRLLGRLTSLRTLGVTQLQGYIAARAKEPGRRGRCVTAATIKKELSTLSAVWSWARESGAVERPLPKRALKLPKSTEKASLSDVGRDRAHRGTRASF